MAEHLVDSVSELPSSMKRGLAELGDTERVRVDLLCGDALS